jgi:hypothetical protein
VRKYGLDAPSTDAPVTFLLSMHGGGSVGPWQREYFPAHLYAESHRLVVATPSAATKEPFRHWVADADDEHLREIVESVHDRFDVASFWLVGHSQGGMTCNRLLRDEWWSSRVDGWLSLSGGRIGPAEIPATFFPGKIPNAAGLAAARRAAGATLHDGDFSFIFATGEHEIVALPDTSPWAERYGAGPRVRLDDVVDTEPGRIHDTLREGRSNQAWGLLPRPGRAEVWCYPGARDGRVIADVVRIDKGHTEGLEPNITRFLIELLQSAR